MKRLLWAIILSTLLVVALVGCSGGSGGGDSNTTPNPTPSPTPSKPSYVWGHDWGGNGSTDGKFLLPKGIAIDASGIIYVVDSGNCRIQRFQGSTMRLKWGTPGTGYGQFNDPYGIAVSLYRRYL
ncbi:MAG: hypothetical protein ACM3TR_14075 [Caulobacteraceae bacterium]